MKLLVSLFILKAGAGLLIGWMSATYYPQGNDYWKLNRHGFEEYELLLKDPAKFFTSILYSPYDNNYGGFFSSVGSYWKDLANNCIIKILAVCNIVSRGNYYINSLFINFLGFFGHVALYQVFIHIFPSKKWLVILGCFLLPTTLYFSSGIHKDGIIFTMLCLFSYAIYFSVRQHFTTKRILLLLFSTLTILLIRNYVFFLLIPAAFALYLSSSQKNVLKKFTILYAVLITLIILISLLIPSSSPLHILSAKQKDFTDLPVANSQLKMDTLQPDLSSFASNTPRAIEHALLRPYVWEFPGNFLMFPAIELLIFQLLFLLMLFKPENDPNVYRPFILFCFFFSLSLLLITGFIVPNAGSLVRYRSIYLPFIVIPILCNIRLKKK